MRCAIQSISKSKISSFLPNSAEISIFVYMWWCKYDQGKVTHLSNIGISIRSLDPVDQSINQSITLQKQASKQAFEPATRRFTSYSPSQSQYQKGIDT